MATRRLNAKALAEALEATAGLTFRDPDRLRRALTHASARGKDAGIDYERMEFLGDRGPGLVVADFLYQTFPQASEGELSLRLNALVNAETLAAISEDIGLPGLITTGSELKDVTERTGGVAYFPESADEIESVAADLARQIRSQYTIAYTPSSQNLDGSYRTIRVTAGGSERYTVKTRRGYRAGPDAQPKGSGED